MEIPFVGREKEISELMQALQSAKSGRGRMYFITGPVGIGKTRLIIEISKYAEKEGFAVLFGHCLDEKAVPYLPLTDVLEKYEKTTAEETYTPLALLGGAVTEAGEETNINVAREKTRVLENYMRKFAEISKKKPLLLVIDDLQWADSGTLSFIHYLSRAISDLPILTIAAYPDEYMKVVGNTQFTETILNINIERNCMTLSLSPLGVNDVSVILGAILGTWKLPKELVEEIHERTGGNPLFVEEIGKAIAEQELFDITQRKLKVDLGEIQLPTTVKSIISQRVSRFDEDTKKVLRACAILGRMFEYEALRNTVEMDEDKLLDILDKLIATGYLEQIHTREEVYKFVHNPVYEVIYTETSAPRRRLMHKKAGIELEKLYGKDRKYFAEIGRHFILGGDAQKGVQYKIMAAEFAIKNYATAECLQNLRDAAGVLENITDENLKREYTFKVYKMLGDCYSVFSDFDKAISAYEKALENALDKKEKVGILIKKSYPLLEKGDFDKCLEVLNEASNMVGEGDFVLQSEINRSIGWVYENRGEYTKAIEYYQKGLELSECAGDEVAMGEAYHRLGTGLWFLGNLRKAREYLEKALEIRKKHNLKKGIAGTYNNLAIILGDMGDIEKSLEYYGIAKKIYEEIGDLSGVSTIYNNLAGIYSLKGEDVEAMEFYKKDLEISKRIGD
ncbi:MAG: BREX system ATP-binding domain-containing protein, partial [Thermoplasmata archaeon]